MTGLPISLFGVAWLSLPVWFLFKLQNIGVDDQETMLAVTGIVLFFILAGLWMLLFPVYRLFEYKNVEYLITEYEIEIRDGLVRENIRKIPFDSIRFLEISKGYMGLYKNIGDVSISIKDNASSDNRHYALVGLHEPVKVADLINEKIKSIKAV